MFPRDEPTAAVLVSAQHEQISDAIDVRNLHGQVSRRAVRLYVDRDVRAVDVHDKIDPVVAVRSRRAIDFEPGPVAKVNLAERADKFLIVGVGLLAPVHGSPLGRDDPR